jgi:hypothetical protein
MLERFARSRLSGNAHSFGLKKHCGQAIIQVGSCQIFGGARNARWSLTNVGSRLIENPII